MTFQKSIEIQERISKNLELLTSAMSGPAFNASNLYLEHCATIVQALNSAGAMSTQVTDAIEAVAQLQQGFSTVVDISYAGIESALRAFEQIPQSLCFTDTFLPDKCLISSLADALGQIEPYLSLEDIGKCETVIEPKLKEQSASRLSLSDMIAILSLLVSIFFGIISSLPDDQTERIIAQNEIIIDQQAEIARLKEEDKALLDALNSLSNSINLLTDEVELLSEKLEGFNDPPNSLGQADTEDAQQQDGNAQD